MRLSIASLELFPIYVATQLWGRELSNKKVIFRSDNTSTVAIIKKKSSACKVVMKMVRRIVLTCLKYNMSIKANHIEGRYNCIADY